MTKKKVFAATIILAVCVFIVLSVCMETNAKDGITELVMGNVTQSDINFIGQLKNLQRLSIQIRDKDLDLSPLANLQYLDELEFTSFGYQESDQIDLSPLGKLTQLRSLGIDECFADMSFIENLTQLKELSITKAEIKDLSVFQNLVKLRRLHVLWVSDTDMSYLSGLDALEYIYIQGDHIRNLSGMENMRNMTCVYLKETERVSDELKSISLDSFANMDKLTHLDIIGLKIEDAAPISQLPELKTISLVGTGIEDIECLGELKNLKELEIYGYGNDYIVNQAVSGFSHLQRLVVVDEIPDNMGYY